MNVFEFARIVELNRAILREGESLNVSHPRSTMGTQTDDPGDATNAPGSGEGRLVPPHG